MATPVAVAVVVDVALAVVVVVDVAVVVGVAVGVVVAVAGRPEMNRHDYVFASLRRAAENGYAWCVSPDDAVALVAEMEQLRAEVAELRALGVSLHKSAAMGRDAERAAVVAWLGAEVDAAMEMHLPVRAATFLECGEAIERGEHRRKEE